jgi:two-component system phosphate regulon sensor histidine kinase PhoR
VTRGIFARLLATNVLIAIGALAVLGVVVDRLLEDRAIGSLRDRLVAEASSAREAITVSSAGPDRTAKQIGRSTGTRITVIRQDGAVVADSERDPATMENHARRPEVIAALAGQTGTDQRVSETVGQPFLYVALPVRDGLVVRAALPAAIVARERGDVRRAVAIGFLAIGAAVIPLTALIARAISRPIMELAAAVPGVAQGTVEHVPVRGPVEVRRLATAVNEMAAELARRLAELEHEAAQREQILGAMNEGVLVIEQGRIAFANRAAREILGAREGAPPPPELEVHQGISPFRFEIHHPVHRIIRAGALDLGASRTLVVAQDITQAERVDRMRRDFVADASHELKTPVAAMRAAAETIRTAIEDDTEAAKRFADQLIAQTERLSDLIRDLLDLARLEREPEGSGAVDLAALVRETAGAQRQRVTARNISLELETLDGAVLVDGRQPELELVLGNLLDNAIRYTPSGGSIRVSLGATQGRARLMVADTGAGIPTKDLPRIFERFYRVDSSRARDTGGSGLGLAIVKHVVERHGGSVAVESQLGAGSTFTVDLPLFSP